MAINLPQHVLYSRALSEYKPRLTLSRKPEEAFQGVGSLMVVGEYMPVERIFMEGPGQHFRGLSFIVHREGDRFHVHRLDGWLA